ncbi:MAG: M48 family metallopeptidase [Alphaproteobacteria bacterium]|nr:M48 family metallopeptidase [Alphaproteobacteria bacterium]
MRKLQFLLLAILALHLSACTSTPESQTPQIQPSQPSPGVTAGIELYMEQRAQVESVGFRLRRTAVTQCAKQNRSKPDLGLIVWSLANFPNEQDRAHLQASFDLTDSVTVALAIKGAPADAAGVTQGDIITHVNDQLLPVGKGATERFITVSNSAARNGPVNVRLSTGRTIAIAPQTACDYPVLLVRSPDINAAADGRAIAITTRFYELTKSQDELALILGHELAHNILGHLKASAPNHSKIGGLLDAFLKSTVSAAFAATLMPPFSIEREKEADYTGLYFMARAGYEISAAESFWTRMINSTSTPQVFKTHPPGPERLKALKLAIREIKTKQNAGAPLEPTLKRRQ